MFGPLSVAEHSTAGRQVVRGMYKLLQWKQGSGSATAGLTEMVTRLKDLFRGAQIEPVVVPWASWKPATVDSDIQARLIHFLRAYIPDFQVQSPDVVFRHLSGETEADMDGP